MPCPNAVADKGDTETMVIEPGSRRSTLLDRISEAGGTVTIIRQITGYLPAYRIHGARTIFVLACFFQDEPPGFDIFIRVKSAE
jgi:hypothetical protein